MKSKQTEKGDSIIRTFSEQKASRDFEDELFPPNFESLFSSKKEIVNYKEQIKVLKTNFQISIEKALSDKQLLEMAINGDIPKIEELQKLGVYGEFLKPKENIIQINAENNEINVNQK